MKIQNVAISLIIACVIVLGSSTFLVDMGDKYDVDIDISGFNETKARMDEQNDKALELNDRLTGLVLELEEASIFNVPYIMIQIGWVVLKSLFSSWSALVSIITDSITTLINGVGIPLPYWVLPMIISIIVITLVIIVISGFFKWRFED